jgi:hypothetical protein
VKQCLLNFKFIRLQYLVAVKLQILIKVKKRTLEEEEVVGEEVGENVDDVPIQNKRRGRPPGSKNIYLI